MKTEVVITIDTEFSVAGAFHEPDRYKPIADRIVNCPVDGKDEGLGFLLDTFERHRVPATFFVEALQATYFGNAPMGRIVERIAGARHDVQLHIHPCWLHFRQPGWRQLKPNDACSGRTDAELDTFIAEGLEIFSQWGLPRPVALRSGGLVADKGFYRAAARAKIPMSSSIGLAVHRPADSDLHLYGGRHRIEGTWEIPVLSFLDVKLGSRQRVRTATITGCASQEIEHLLWQARNAGISPVVILTHPFEYVKSSDFRYTKLRRNRINQARLNRLLQFLCAHDEEFAAVTFADRTAQWTSAEIKENPVFSTPLHLTIGRTVQNVLNDYVWAY